MANNYTRFSEVIPRLTQEEEQWLDEQLAVVCIFDDVEYDEDKLPSGKDPEHAEYNGCRAFRDLPDDAGWNEEVGFDYSFQTDDDERPEGWGRHLWIYTEEGGDVERIAHLVQKFLKKFRPDQCWSLSYSETCSKPRVGEFGGGAMFVTAAEIKWQSSYSFRCAEEKAFAERSSAKGGN